MEIGLNFQISKVNRLIRVNGETFAFKRQKKNEYGEPIKEEYEEILVKGFYHESSSYISEKSSDYTVSRSKPSPFILCSIDDGKKLEKNDMLSFNGKNYKLIDLTNVNELNICFDISLEVIHDG